MLKIQFVSDVSCTWCAISLHSLQAALDRVGDAIDAEIVFEPFELNPDMPAGGQNLTEHVNQKYGSTHSQFAQSRAMFRERGEEVGFVFNLDDESRIYNTFDAHRLLHWAGLTGRQHALKVLLFRAHFTEGRDPGDRDLLVTLAAEAGLDPVEARRVLEADLYAAEVREREREWIARGVRSVPTIVFNEREAIVGGQSVDAFEALIRKLADQSANA